MSHRTLTLPSTSPLRQVIDSLRIVYVDPTFYTSRIDAYLLLTPKALDMCASGHCGFASCIGVRDLSDLFGTSKEGDPITLDVDDISDRIGISIGRATKRHRHEFPRMNTRCEQLRFNKDHYDGIASMLSTRLLNLVQSLSFYADPINGGDNKVVISMTEDNELIFSTHNDVSGPVNLKAFGTTVEVKKPASFTCEPNRIGTFMLGAMRLSKYVTIYISSHLPLVVEYEIPRKLGFVRFYLEN